MLHQTRQQGANMGANPVAAALAGAHKALDSANKFTGSVTGGKPSAFAPKPEAKAQPEKTDYSHARDARKDAGHEFLGVRSNEAPELKSALDAREQAKKALDQQ
jgi:hypothetical protein